MSAVLFDPRRLALERALDLARQQVSTLEAALGQPEPLVSLKVAAHEMGIEQAAATKRARRGSGVQLDGRWFFPRSYVDGVKAAKMSR